MWKESMPTASARIASSTALRITWSPLIGSPPSSTVTGRNVSRPNSSIKFAPPLLLDHSNVLRSAGIPSGGDAVPRRRTGFHQQLAHDFTHLLVEAWIVESSPGVAAGHRVADRHLPVDDT